MSATVVACLCLASTATALIVSPPSSYGVAASMRVWAASAPARSDSDRFTNSRRWSFEGGDLPSDVDADSSAAAPSVLAGDNPELRETIKREILSIAATSNRTIEHWCNSAPNKPDDGQDESSPCSCKLCKEKGQVATQEEKDSAMDLLFQLEALNPTPDATNVNIIGGVWELVYSDVQPFRASPFFMAFGELFGDNTQRADTAFALHRTFTANSEIGRVRQIISEAKLISEVDLRVGVLPGVPLELKGTVVTKAGIKPISSDSFNVVVESTRVTNNNILTFLDDNIEVPVEQVYSTLRGSVPECKFSTFYLDENMRVSRTPDDHVFVFIRAASSS